MRQADTGSGPVDRELLERLCTTVTAVTGFDAAVLTVWAGSPHPVIGAHGIAPAQAEALARLVLPGHEDDRELAAADGAESSFRDRLSELGFLSSSRVPVTEDGHVVGLLVVLAAAPRHPDSPLLSALARVCESALQYAPAPSEPLGLTDLDALVLSSDSFRTLIPAMTVALSAKLGGIGVGLSVADEDSGMLLTADGSFGLPVSVTRRFPIDPGDLHSNAARVFELQQPFASNQVIGDPAVLQNYPQAFGIRNMLALPLVVDGRSIGVLMIVNKEDGFHADDMVDVAPFLPRLALAVEMARLSEQRRFSYKADGIVAALRVAALHSPPDEARVAEALAQARDLLAADDLAVQPGHAAFPPSGVTAASAHRAPRSQVELACGGSATNQVLRATRASNGFGRSERALLADLARVLGESASLQRTRRQEEELAQHRERQRIADDLHDDVSQLLFAAQLALTAEPSPQVSRAVELVRTAETALRDAIFLLEAPPEPFSHQVESMLRSAHAQWGLVVDPVIDPAIDDVPEPVGAELLRASRECLANAAKHSEASRVLVVLRFDAVSSVEMIVEDDGIGLPGLDEAARPGAMRHGIRALRRRAEALGGRLSVSRIRAGGTRVVLRLPTSTG